MITVQQVHAIVDGVMGSVRGYVAQVTDDLATRLATVETRAALPGPEGPAGADGDPGPRGEHGPAGPPGAPGPTGLKGDPGPTGDRGLDGHPGPRGEQGDAVAGPRGEKGLDGTPGARGDKGDPGPMGQKGLDGPAGKDGLPGRDGRDGAQGRDGEKGLDGRPGQDGRDGTDGFALDDFTVEQAADFRTFTWKFGQGARVKTWTFVIPAAIYRGIYQPGAAYAHGDQVTKGDGVWTAMADTAEIPGDGQTAWTLSMKRGREGKPGPRGEKGDAGQDGRHGKDLTHLGPDGSKW